VTLVRRIPWNGRVVSRGGVPYPVTWVYRIPCFYVPYPVTLRAVYKTVDNWVSSRLKFSWNLPTMSFSFVRKVA